MKTPNNNSCIFSEMLRDINLFGFEHFFDILILSKNLLF